MFTSLCLVFYLFQCLLCFTKYRLLNVDIFYDVASSKMIVDNKLLCAKECMEFKLCCVAFAYHEDRKTCYFYDFKLHPDYVNISDPGVFTYVDVEEDGEKQYYVTIGTGDGQGDGTKNHVRIRIFGTEGRTSQHLLDIDGYNDFQRNALDTYQVDDVDVGTITVVNLHHDNTYYDNWFLTDVEITTCLSDESTRTAFMNRNDGDVRIPSIERYHRECSCLLRYHTDQDITLHSPSIIYTTKINRI